MPNLILTPVDLEGKVITTAYGRLVASNPRAASQEVVGGGEFLPGESTEIHAEPNGYVFKKWIIESDSSQNIWHTKDNHYEISLIKDLTVKAVLDPTGDWVAVNNSLMSYINGASVEDKKLRIFKDNTACFVEGTKVTVVN